MLSDSNIRQINRQISDELDSLWHLDDDEKLAAIARVKELKSILDPAPTVEDIVATLKSPKLPNDLASDIQQICQAFRRTR